MFAAAPSDNTAPPTAYLLGAPVDPLGQIAASAKMYKGEAVHDLSEITDEERRYYLGEIGKTALKMPLEGVQFHFLLENVHRGITHQIVRQRTAAFAQESMRFAVKEDVRGAVALPPSLEGSRTPERQRSELLLGYASSGIPIDDLREEEVDELVWKKAKGPDRARLRWERAVGEIEEAYLGMINDGIPAEDARGILPTNILTRINYITNLRGFLETISARVSDQAQFEWRFVAMAYAKAMREYGRAHSYFVWIEEEEWKKDGCVREAAFGERDGRILVERSSEWQYAALTAEMKPIEFRLGGPAFGADFDRPSRIGERVRAFAARGVPSERWLEGAPEHNIPALHPDEWLLDPASARLAADQEFDVWGNRVTKGTGSHWRDGFIYNQDGAKLDWTGRSL
jgi:flavin-dependent thymidylate synthase